MKYAQAFLQFLYGGIDTRPDWQICATNTLQELNWGYHPGRFINCIEISMHAFKSILLSKGKLRFSVTPLPTIPPFIPGYTEKLYERFSTLENEDRRVCRQRLGSGGTYQALLDWLSEHNVPAYSHFILLTDLKKLPGGHVISGVVLSSDDKGLSVFLYDAQGFIPDAWLAEEQFDDYYSIDFFFIYQSELTRESVRSFVNQFQSPKADLHAPKIEERFKSHSLLLRDKLLSFIELELFRLNAKQLVAAKEDENITAKIKDYQNVLGNLSKKADLEITYSFIARCLLETSQIVKQHSYSLNWFNPQSFSHFMIYFQDEVNHSPFNSSAELGVYIDYLNHFLIFEIIRICMINESTNIKVDKKVEKLIGHLEEMEQDELQETQLLEIIHKLKQTCCERRHMFGFYTPESAIAFNNYILPLQSVIETEKDQTTPEKEEPYLFWPK